VISTDVGKQLAEKWKGAFLEASAKENTVWIIASFPFGLN